MLSGNLPTMSPTSDRTGTFRRLHESGCFVIPNPWDVGSARLLERLGFPALATTSSGFAWSLGRPDNGVSLAQALSHFRSIVESVGIPVNGDFEGGFATEPAEVGANVAAATSTGIAGISIEDSTGDASHPLFDFTLAVERVRAAREAIEAGNTGVRRISVGGALARAAWTGFLEAAKEIAEQGTFTGLAGAVPFADVNQLFAHGN
jgi:2-methylisocitrate lyase-like PEP mutase family enzyme